jgi:hypothetical protein
VFKGRIRGYWLEKMQPDEEETFHQRQGITTKGGKKVFSFLQFQ